MTAPTDFIWELAGRPDPIASKMALIKDVEAICCVTGNLEARTADANKALGSNFTDRSMFKAPHSGRVGIPTIWCSSGGGLQTLRLWTIIAAPGYPLPPSSEKAFLQKDGLWLGNRGNPRPLIEVLSAPPDGEWMVTIAVSGQKHVVPYGTVNRGAGPWVVRYEDANIASTPKEWATVHGHALALRRMKIGTDNILKGIPPIFKTKEDLDAWQSHADPLMKYRNSPLLDFALWTITKDIINADT